jgi:hypothetical protein
MKAYPKVLEVTDATGNDTCYIIVAAESMAVGPHPPSLPDLAPCDLFVFLRKKAQLERCHFQVVCDIQEQLLVILHTLSNS